MKIADDITLLLLLLLLLSISKWVTQKARSLHKVVPSRYTHTITTTKEAILYNTHTSILTHIQLQQKIIFTTRIHNTLYICTYTHNYYKYNQRKLQPLNSYHVHVCKRRAFQWN